MDETTTTTVQEAQEETTPNTPATTTKATETPSDTQTETKSDTAEVSRLRAALDKASKEAADYKRQLRKTQTEEERRAAEKEEADQALQEEVAQLRKQAALGGISKRVLAFVGDEKVADSVAEAIYGAEDVDAVMDALAKAWSDKEKKLRLEFSKLPAPDGGDDGPTMTKADLMKLSYAERSDFARKHPETYQKLMN